MAGASVFTITATATGVGTLTYSIDGIKFQTANTFDVVPGSYEITVKDGNGCPVKTQIDVYHAMTAAAVLTKDLSCATPTAAKITVTVAGGKGPYLYQTKIGAAGSYGASTSFAGPTFTYDATDVAGNTYQFLITDSNIPVCTIETNVITTHEAVNPTAVTSFVNPTCNGSSDGSITLGASGGIAPYEYSIDNGITFTKTHIFGGLAEKKYDYIIRDKNGCDAKGDITLVDPAPIVPTIIPNSISCATRTLCYFTGSIDVDIISGGVAPFTYKLYDNSFTLKASYTTPTPPPPPAPPAVAPPPPSVKHSFTGLDFGDYYITIVDANGCEFKSTKEKINAAPFLELTSNVAGATCDRWS